MSRNLKPAYKQKKEVPTQQLKRNKSGSDQIKNYFVQRVYAEKLSIFGEEASQSVPAAYTAFKYFLNINFYKTIMKDFSLMPFCENNNMGLIELSQNGNILSYPVFVDGYRRKRRLKDLKFFNKIAQLYPYLNIFVYHIKIGEYSTIYEELNPRAQYQRRVVEFLNDFQAGFPAAISYSELDYDLNDYRKYFYRSDHHWTIQGAWHAYAQVIGMIGKKVPDIGSPVEPKKIYKVPGVVFRGSSAKKAAYKLISDDLWDYEIKFPPHEVIFNERERRPRSNRLRDKPSSIFENYYGLYWGDDYGFIHYAAAPGKRNLLVFADSYSNCIEAYFIFHYSNVYLVDLRFYQKDMKADFNLANFLKEHPVDDILFFLSSPHLFEDERFNFPSMLEQ